MASVLPLKIQYIKAEKSTKVKKPTCDDGDSLSKSSKRRKVTGSDEKCVFCDEKVGVLHSFSTIEADRNLRRIVTDLQDFELLAKISGGDLIAIEAKYHMKCLT